MTALCVLLGLGGWYILGCLVLAAVDHKDQRLLKWVQTAPNAAFYVVTIMCWPYVAWRFRR